MEATPGDPDESRQFGRLRLEVDEDGILLARISSPGRLNAWTTGMRTELALALSEAAESDAVRGVVITGEGRDFCAGQDLNEQASWDPETDQMDNFERVYRTVLEFSKPTVAAIEGAAIGSGMQLALLCDLRIVSSAARIGQTEVRWGMPSVTGTWLLSQVAGPARARMLSLTTDLVEGDQLLDYGLADELVAEGTALQVARERARALASHPPAAYALTKCYCAEAWRQGFEQAFAAARDLHRIASDEGHEKEGAERFLARTKESRA